MFRGIVKAMVVALGVMAAVPLSAQNPDAPRPPRAWAQHQGQQGNGRQGPRRRRIRRHRRRVAMRRMRMRRGLGKI